VSGPTTAASVIVYGSLSTLATPGTAHYITLAITLAMMVGVTQLAMGFARLGSLVNFISPSVVVGFTAGAAVLIAVKQIPNFFGIEAIPGAEFYEIFGHLFRHAASVDGAVLAVGAVTLLSGIASRRLMPRVPYMLVALLSGSLAAFGLRFLPGLGDVEIPMVGALPPHLPPLSMPDVSLGTLRDLAPAALVVTLFALTEAVSIARSLALRSGQHFQANQEFIGQGLSNVVGSFFSSYVATGSFNRSGINYQAGAKTPLAAVFAGLLLMGIIVPVAPLGAYLPNAAMAGLLFLVAWGLVDLHHIRKIVHASGAETGVMAATFVAALVIGLEFAILLGVILSLMLYLRRTSRPQVSIRTPDPRLPKRRLGGGETLPQCPQLALVRIDGSLFYGAVAHVSGELRQIAHSRPHQTHLAVIATGINFIDLAGAELLAQEAAARRARGGDLYLLGPKAQVREYLAKSGYLEEIGRDHLFPSKTSGLAAIQTRLDAAVCRSCPQPVFLECAGGACPQPRGTVAAPQPSPHSASPA